MAVSPLPTDFSPVSPYLLVEDVDDLLSFLEEVFDGKVRTRHTNPDKSTMHAEYQIGDSVIMMGTASKDNPALKSMIHVYVEHVDATFERAMEAGAVSIRPPEDTFYGDRSGGFVGPQGNMWWIATHVEDVSEEEILRRSSQD